MPCPRPLIFSHIADYVYDVCPPSDPDVGHSVLACDVERTSFHFGMCGRKFVLCLFGVLVSAPCYVIAGNTYMMLSRRDWPRHRVVSVENVAVATTFCCCDC